MRARALALPGIGFHDMRVLHVMPTLVAYWIVTLCVVWGL